ncbi:hypothetical protein E5357_03245 [Hominisplanchenecus murintestinalis]|uniref:Uncharacterized protein n=1 Tax=Hominisplanchenecus murintestinalis TaxID=2941517 RepID=A0AC61R494_9FIRM|nr:hypothetical protein [Hominisplanchenecus murintestinalis]NBH96961.1 hypothetical protein [Lachnospiraceae bacterium]NBI74138.1 hypothetical protein [Lachnospiraceae bacterium]TGY00048.1 hypothetical protein E5357_03245 [Hominisplanchenecus murintestinalis]
MKMNETYRRRIDMLLVFLLAMAPRLILIFTVSDPLRTPMDEMSTMSAGAWAAGMDWTKAAEYGGRYYGGGMTILMAPLFWMFSNPVALYRACLVFCAVLQSLAAPIAYHILNVHMKVEKKIYLYLASLAAGFMMVNRALVVYNEHMLILASWLTALILCKLIAEDRKERRDYRKQAAYSVVLMVLLSYSLTLHTRAKTLWIALVLLVLLYFLMYKSWLVAKIPALVSGITGYWLAGRFIYWAKTTLWLWHEGEKLENTAVNLNLSVKLLLSPASWQGWFATVLGQVHVSVIFTGGFSAIAITLLMIYICKNGKALFFKKKKHPVTENFEQLEVKTYILVLGIFFLMCIGATILAQSISWLFRVEEALRNSPWHSTAYGYKAFTYFRYYGSYIGPFFLAALAYIYHYRIHLKKYLPAVFAVFVGLQILFLCAVLPHITNNMVASEVYWAFGLHKALSDPMRLRVYLGGVLVCSISFLVMFVCLCKGKRTLPAALLLALLVYQYVYNGVYVDGSYSERYHTRAEQGYELIHGLEEAGCELPGEIYVSGYKESQTQKALFTYQFMLNRYRILPGVPEESVEDAIILGTKLNYDELIQAGYSCADLNKTESVYVKGEKYRDMIEEYAGLSFAGAGQEAEG